MSNHRLHAIWRQMRQRCNNPNHRAFKWYGGKGVKVCQEWGTFENFMTWALANGYDDGLTIDRKESDGNYDPNNCRWITRAENTRRARKGKPGGNSGEPITYKGKTQSLDDWSKELGISYITLYKRLEAEWSVEDAFGSEVGSRTNKDLITYEGVTRPIQEWAEEYGIKLETLRQRLYRLHWSVEKALTKKTRSKKA